MFLNLLTDKKEETTKYFGWILYTTFLFFDECSSFKMVQTWRCPCFFLDNCTDLDELKVMVDGNSIACSKFHLDTALAYPRRCAYVAKSLEKKQTSCISAKQN